MTMTLCSLLEIKLSLVRAEDRPGLEAAERMWSRAGKPTTRSELIAFLEQFLTTAVAEGYGYPAIFLRRKREMQRGDWTPQAKRDAAEAPDTAVTSGKIPREWIKQAEQRERAKLRLPTERRQRPVIVVATPERLELLERQKRDLRAKGLLP